MTRENPTRSHSCRRVRRDLQSHLDGVLEDAAARRVADHLEGCRRCLREAEAYQAIKNSLSRRRSSPEAVQRLRAFGEALLDDPGESSSHTERSVSG